MRAPRKIIPVCAVPRTSATSMQGDDLPASAHMQGGAFLAMLPPPLQAPARQQPPAARAVKQRWSAAEDQMLRDAVAANGAQNWQHIASFLPNRNGARARLASLLRLPRGVRARVPLICPITHPADAPRAARLCREASARALDEPAPPRREQGGVDAGRGRARRAALPAARLGARARLGRRRAAGLLSLPSPCALSPSRSPGRRSPGSSPAAATRWSRTASTTTCARVC